MSWHFLQGQEAASWEGTCLDGAPSALLSLIPTPEAFSSPDNATDACHDSRCGTTCGPSTASHGEAMLTSSAEDSPAKTSAPQEREPELTESDPAFGGRWRELWVKYDRVACGWKTHRCLWTEALPWSSVTSPKWGMMRDGVLWERTTPEPRTSGIGVGWWPTPRAGNPGSRPNGKGGKILAEGVEIAEGLRVRNWPTPTACMSKGSSEASLFRKDGASRESDRLDHAIMAINGGQLNPNWVEWLMGWPLGWTSMEPIPESTFAAWERAFRTEPTDSSALETDKFQPPL